MGHDKKITWVYQGHDLWSIAMTKGNSKSFLISFAKMIEVMQLYG